MAVVALLAGAAALACPVWSAASAGAALQGGGLTIESYLARTGLGEVTRSPDSRSISFARLAAYDRVEYPPFVIHPLFARILRSQLFVQAVDAREPVEIRIEGSRAVWGGPWSPDSKRLIVFNIDHRWSIGMGLWDLSTRQYRRLPGSLDFPWGLGRGMADWAGPERIVYAVIPDGQPISVLKSSNSPAHMLISDSGSAEEFGMRIGSKLVVFDLVSDQLHASGIREIEGLMASPDGRHTAVFFLDAVTTPHPKKALTGYDQSAYMSTMRRVRLGLFDAGSGQLAASSPEHIDVYPGSAVWSPSGQVVAYVAKDRNGTWEENAEVWTTAVTGRSIRLRTDGLELYSWFYPDGLGAGGTTGELDWLGERVVTTARPAGLYRSSAGNPKPGPEFQMLSARAQPVALSKFVGHGINAACRAGNRWLGISEGAPHVIFSNGRFQPLLQDHASSVLQWHRPFTSGEGSSPLACGASADGVIVASLKEAERAQLAAVSLKNGAVLARFPGRDAGKARFAALAQGSAVELEEHSGNQRLSLLNPLRELVAAGIGPVELGETISFKFTPARAPHPQSYEAWIVLPPGHQKRGRLPLIVLLYGGDVYSADQLPFWAEPATHNYINAQLFAAQGYAVLIPSLPLSARFGIDIIGELQASASAAIDRAAELGFADRKRIALMGHSFGGYTALALATRLKDVRAVIAHAPATNLVSFYMSFFKPFAATGFGHQTMEWARWAERGQGRLGMAPWKDPQRYIANSPIFHVSDITAPVLLIHGMEDEVPVGQSEEMFQALYRERKKARLLRFPNESHFMTQPRDIEETLRQMFTWLEGNGMR